MAGLGEEVVGRVAEVEGPASSRWANLSGEVERIQREIDEILYRTERAMTHPDGLPGRPWFVHRIYAPGFYTGYGVKTLPGVREAMEERNWDEAQRQIRGLAETLVLVATEIKRATELLVPVTP